MTKELSERSKGKPRPQKEKTLFLSADPPPPPGSPPSSAAELPFSRRSPGIKTQVKTPLSAQERNSKAN